MIEIKQRKPWKGSRLGDEYKKFYPYCCYYNHQPTKWIPLYRFLMDEDIIAAGLVLGILSAIVVSLWRQLIKGYNAP